MTIPLDKLYQFIANVAQKIHRDDVIIYRFFPHGSKKIENLIPLEHYSIEKLATLPHIYCNDQEPLNYNMYSNLPNLQGPAQPLFEKYNAPIHDYNLCVNRYNVYDSFMLLHSEQRSTNLELYNQDKYFTPVYYWSHAIIALDWFRYAKHDTFIKKINKTFLIYNRAWSGTREYRLKFVDLLVDYDLIDQCQTKINPIEPELNIHYRDYKFDNKQFVPKNILEHHVTGITTASSSSSADYCKEDYTATEFEIVLETLFDDDRLHLTEKILRPIAVGQPFLLAATHGSLEYLRSYGFKTFSDVVDESYDTIVDPLLRLHAIANSMKEITNWTSSERKEKILLANKIAAYNRQHFFSHNFFNQVQRELYSNLSAALDQIENTNTGRRFIDRRKDLCKYTDIKSFIISADRPTLVKILSRARTYYNKH